MSMHYEIILPEATHQILDMIFELTGKPCRLIHRPQLQVMATVKIARQNMPAHLIYYANEFAENLGHLVAHECMHIRRIMTAPAETRKVPVSNQVTRMLAFAEMGDEIVKIIEGNSASLKDVIPEFHEWVLQKAKSINDVWINGLITQVTNYPVDLRIEKYLYDQYPELRDQQKITLDAETRVGALPLAEEYKRSTPKKIYNASITMNCAYAGFMQKLTGAMYLTPYKKTEYIGCGRRISKAIMESKDAGYDQDLKTINEWAKLFGLQDWFYWDDFENVPEGYAQS